MPLLGFNPDLSAVTLQIKQRSRELGFDLVGIAPAEASKWRNYFRTWLDEGRAGEMNYLGKRFDERVSPSTYLPGAKSVICLGVNYHVPLEPPSEEQRKSHGRIARYALGDDYHDALKPRLHALADWLRGQFPGSNTRACVDTAPVMEKELAARAGVGWIGKNTCLINPKIGSWLLLGEVLTTLSLVADEPATDHCGTCTRCIDACPTDAIINPYQLDARKCISYLTIEHRGPIPADLAPKIGNWLYGCDVCQDVCPHNGKAPGAADQSLLPRFPTGTLDPLEVLDWTNDAYRLRLRGSAMKRVKLTVLKRNAAIVIKNAGQADAGPGPAPLVPMGGLDQTID